MTDLDDVDNARSVVSCVDDAIDMRFGSVEKVANPGTLPRHRATHWMRLKAKDLRFETTEPILRGQRDFGVDETIDAAKIADCPPGKPNLECHIPREVRRKP